ncbi:hypothetical protein [Brevundimonas sp.]|uniref:hypothetical protein n=1 Tax=Brevundimonas sp. TaxID=1871086 RepID=UPI00378332FC
MPRKSQFKASGKNDVWFAVFFIAAITIVSLLAQARDIHAPGRPEPVPASQIKE